MSLRSMQLDEDYQSGMSAGLILAVVLHVGLVVLGGVRMREMHQSVRPLDVRMGYEGPSRPLETLEVLDPNSVHSYFYQRERKGRLRTQNFAVVKPLPVDPGPQAQPVPVQREKQQNTDTDLDDAFQDVEPVAPLMAAHADISYSETFVILKLVKPDYPEYERARSIQGRVVVTCYINAAGRIEETIVTQTLMDPATASPHAFELAAIEALRQWEVRPPKGSDGQRRGIWLPVPFQFDIYGVSSDLEKTW